jgi:chromosome partitioning protein
MFDGRTRLSFQILDSMKNSEHLGPLVFNTVIRKNVRLAEAPDMRRSIFHAASKSYGANDYAGLAIEIAERCGMRAPEEPTESAEPEAAAEAIPAEIEAAPGTENVDHGA